MHNPPDILSLAYRQSVLQDQFVMLQEKVRLIPGSVQYTINRYHNTGNWSRCHCNNQKANSPVNIFIVIICILVQQEIMQDQGFMYEFLD